MFKWVTDTVMTAATTAAQLTKAAIDTVVDDDEAEPTELSAAARLMFDVDDNSAAAGGPSRTKKDSRDDSKVPVNGGAAPMKPRPVKADCSDDEVDGDVKPTAKRQRNRVVTTQADPKPRALPPPSSPPPSSATAPQGSESWVPPELRFASEQPKHLLNIGMNLLEKGAGLALSIIPPLEDEGPAPSATLSAPHRVPQPAASQPASTPASKTPTATAAVAVAVADPMTTLRTARGAALLARRSAAGQPEVEAAIRASEVAASVIDPALLVDYEAPAPDSQEARALDWVATTALGARLQSVADDAVTQGLAGTDGRRRSAAELAEVLDTLPHIAEQASDAVAQALVSELADVVGHHGKAETCEWLMRGDAASLELRARNALSVAHFALMVMSRAVAQLCDAAQECATWARRADRADAKAIKDKSLSVRGECFVASAAAAALLEEAFECVIVLFPPLVAAPTQAKHVDPSALQPVKKPSKSLQSARKAD